MEMIWWWPQLSGRDVGSLGLQRLVEKIGMGCWGATGAAKVEMVDLQELPIASFLPVKKENSLKGRVKRKPSPLS